MIFCLFAYFVEPKSEVSKHRPREGTTGESDHRYKGKRLRLVACDNTEGSFIYLENRQEGGEMYPTVGFIEKTRTKVDWLKLSQLF